MAGAQWHCGSGTVASTLGKQWPRGVGGRPGQTPTPSVGRGGGAEQQASSPQPAASSQQPPGHPQEVGMAHFADEFHKSLKGWPGGPTGGASRGQPPASEATKVGKGQG